MSDESETPTPGARWRLLAHREHGNLELKNEGIFDELVVDDWLHIEQMDQRIWWLRIGDADVVVEVAPSGEIRVDVERGAHGDVRGGSKIYTPPAEDQAAD